MAANTNQGGVREVTTTIEKCGLEEGRELQWQIRNFDTIRSSCLAVIRQNFGPLNGKVTLKLDLTRLQNGSYELGIQVEPLKDVMWMNVQFKMHGEEVTEFAISGDLRSVAGNRLAYALEVPALNTLKFTFVPEILLSVSNVVGGSQSENQQSQQNSVPPFNTEWVNQLPPFLQHIVNQRIAEGQHWVNFFRDYPTDFTQMQQSLMSALNSSELVRETPRMLQSLYDELLNNPDYSQISQRLQDLLAGTQPQPENVQPQAQQNQQQNTQPPTTEQPTTEQPRTEQPRTEQPNNEQPAFGSFPPVTYNMCEFIERGFKNAARRRAEQRQARSAAFNANSAPTENVLNREDEFTQIYNTMADTYKNLMNAVNGIPLNQQAEVISQPTPQQNVQPTAPPSDVPMETVTQQPVQQHIQEPVQQPIQESVQQEPVQQPIQEPVQQEPVQQGIYPLIDLTADEPIQSTSNDNRSRSESATDWTFLFTAKGITGYIYHVKNLGSRVPYHRNFCSSETWKMPDGQELKVELVHALHPDAPFICLIDVNEASDMAFVQTLIDGNGQELHKIDSFSDSYHGFTVDQLLQSASVDDVVRIKIEAIPNMD